MPPDNETHLARTGALAGRPFHADITSQRAAEMLHVSRPCPIKLPDDRRRREVVRELTQEAERLGLGY